MTARILVVDDIAANLRLLEAKLLNEYYEVALAANLLWTFETDRNCGCYGSAYLQGGFGIARYTYYF